ncbi:hypothetical protein [Gordonia aurantiaca]|uniref:hypothetical protein n=1 Tax=Gordonia sp. B21 TaxID=3151852 RepID=UPI003267E5C9
MATGGRGDYAVALTALDGIVAGVRAVHGAGAPGVHGAGAPGDDDAAILSLCLSTRASLLRQGGRHDRALGVDGQALAAVAGARPCGGRDAVDLTRAAAADALVGLAADNLGLLRFGASSRLLARARALLGIERPDTGSADVERIGSADVERIGSADVERSAGGDVDWLTFSRCRLRWEWVSAELGLYSGDVSAGLEHAEAGARLVRRLMDTSGVPVRHRTKTELILAAATAASGRRDEAVAGARGVLVVAAQEGLLPLEWAAWALLTGLGDVSAEEEKRYGHLRATLICKGMALESGGHG